MKRTLLTLFSICSLTLSAQTIVHPSIGTKVFTADSSLSIELIAKKQYYDPSDEDTADKDINSPKSVNMHPNGTKYYVNSLEGATTVVYDFKTNEKLKVIHHEFTDSDTVLLGNATPFYTFTHHLPDANHPASPFGGWGSFYGKPVESTFSHRGRYRWIPYYRRSYDINAQDPSAVAIIDTQSDKIIRLMETGPLPKMIATSPDGKYVAISHWGNNTVGIIDISSPNPREWKHKACHIVDYKLNLNFSLTHAVDRDNGSGYALRGTVFTPDNHYLLVGCMGGGGGIAVIDLHKSEYLGRLQGMMANVRHLILKNGYLYLSINNAGYVQKIAFKSVLEAISKMSNKRGTLSGFKSVKVGGGARTIELSPSGKYIFAACNSSSELYVVDALTMKVLTSIPVDSYPVGLDLSKDGKYALVTSQGRSGKDGGNAVNIYKVTYHTLK